MSRNGDSCYTSVQFSDVSSKVPRVRKSSIHLRNCDSHVTVRPSVPQAYQCKIGFFAGT